VARQVGARHPEKGGRRLRKVRRPHLGKAAALLRERRNPAAGGGVMSRTFTMKCEGEDVTVTIVEFLQLTGSSPDGRHHYSAIVGMTDADQPAIQLTRKHT